MNRKRTIVIFALCLTLSHLVAQNPIDSASTDTTKYYIAESDTSSLNYRSSMGDRIEMPFLVGTKSGDFSYTDYRYANSFSDYYHGLIYSDVFYEFTLSVPMNVTITHEGSYASDTYMSLLDSNGNLIEANDNYSGEGHCANTYHSFIRRQLDAGTYYVVSECYTNYGYIRTNITGNASSDFNYPTIPSTYSTSPSTFVGGIGGQFSVSPMGGATYSIPIDVPPGVGGLQPQLSIVYNSQSDNGLCGFGANLSGISAITRGPKNIYHDGTAQGINYQTVDVLYLDGVRLILDPSSTAGQNGAVYYPESNPFTRVIEHNAYPSSNNDTWFEVQSSDGMVYEYGHDSGSRLSYTTVNSNRTHSWYISRAQQPTGNYMIYRYQQDNYCVYPHQITYGSNINQQSTQIDTVSFTYEDRSDSVLIRFDGKHGRMGRRLKTITGSTNGNIYRSYTLNYDTSSDGTAYKFSRLTGVTEKNGQNQSLPSMQLHWSYLPQMSYLSNSFQITPATNIPSSITTNDNAQIIDAGDLNKDGISDVIKIVPAEEQEGNSTHYCTIVNIFYSSVNASGQVSFTTADDYYNIGFLGDFACTSVSMKGRMIVDIDGDGINELLIPIYKATGGANSSRVRFYVIGQNYNCEYCHIVTSPDINPLFTSGDIDNDGKSEIIYLETVQTNGLYRMYAMKHLGPNAVLQQYAQYGLNLASNPKYIFLTDMNNNGLNDLLIVCQNNYTVYWNQGSSILTSMYSDSFKTTSSDFGYWYTTVPGDYNGDGLMDFLTTTVGSSAWKLFINNGNGTFTMNSACSLGLYEQSFTINDDDKFHCDVLDFDRDGKDDVVITKAMYDHYGYIIEFNKTHTYWLRSTGTTLEMVYHATSNKASDAKNNVYMTGDFDGDGRKELANYGYDCVSSSNANTDASWHIYRNSGFTAQTGKVTSITGEFGVTTNITYSTLTDSTVYTRGAAEPYPAPRYTIPLSVVKQTVQNNGAAGSLTTQYAYEGLKAHLQGRGLLGFCKTTANCTTTGVISESGITQWDTVFYIPKVTYSKTNIGNSYAHTTDTLTITDKGQKKYFAYPSQIVATDMDGNIVTTVRSFNTTYGYPESETSTYGTNMYRSTAYSNYVLAGGVYRPQAVTLTQRHQDDTSPFSVTTTYTYDSTTGAVTSMVENYGTSKPLTTSYTYDAFGNLTSQVSTGTGVTNCTTYYTYDQTHRFPIRIYTNPASSVMKYTYDVFGNILTERDSINSSISNTVTHTYNAWGQLIRTDMPDGTSTTYTRGWNNDAGKRYFILTQGTATPWVKTWYDNRGREVMTESIGPMNVSVTSSTSYNSKGLVSSHTENDGNLSLTQNYTYDSRGRVATESYTGGRALSYQYGNRSMTVTENNTRTTTTTYDAWGNVKTVTAPISSISNTYASNGGIRQTDVGGATWTFQYDDRGNRTSMSDPDAGTTTYEYDAFGRETKRTDARNVVFETKYDYLGRVTQRKAGTDAINYTYWTSGNGQLSLKSESNSNWTKSYAYDSHRRVTTETMTDGTVTKTKTYQYGTNGLVSQRNVPGSKTYVYTYDSYGNLTGVDFGAGTVRWNLTGYTGKNTVSGTVIDNYTGHPFIKTTALDSNGMLDHISTYQDNWYMQDDDYSFSPQTGNLMSMSGQNWVHPRTYTYDNADRLTSVQQDNQNLMSVAYSANGNITSKTNIGSYTYGSTDHPHAVTAVENTAGIYSMNDQYVSYDSWGNVCNVWQTDNTDFYNHSIVYGPDLKRVTSETHKTYNTLFEKFYWDDYEERKVGNDLYQYYYVYGGDGLAGLHIVKTTPNSSTTTHTTKVLTDHLGSITDLVDNEDWVYQASFDPWGNRYLDMLYLFDPYFDRGYTGHEHLLCPFGLINMNGRMYDPNLGRFLSPDNYIQSPGNPQNYNRYSYCLNNPLKYTDPDGEIIWMPIIIAAAMGGVQGTMVGLQNDAEGWNLVGYIAGGAALGALSGGMAQGMAAIGANTFVTQLACNAATSSLGAGMMSGWDGKSMLMGLGSGLLSGCVSGAISLSYDPVGLINGMLADGAVNAGIGAISGGINAAAFGGDLWDGALNGAIMGGLSGMAFGAYRGWTNAGTLGVNHWTGGTLQERAQAWANYYGLPGEMFSHASQKILDEYVETRGKDYRYYSQYNGIGLSIDPRQVIDGFCSDNRDMIFLSGKTIRHARFNTGWGKGTFYHEYFHSLSESNHKNEAGAYEYGYKYGGIRYYNRLKEMMNKYGIPR